MLRASRKRPRKRRGAKERDEFLERELADLETSVQNLKSLTVELQGKLEEQFKVGVDKITTEFDRFFKANVSQNVISTYPFTPVCTGRSRHAD